MTSKCHPVARTIAEYNELSLDIELFFLPVRSDGGNTLDSSSNVTE